jgi:hypothetical protein
MMYVSSYYCTSEIEIICVIDNKIMKAVFN